MLIHGQPLPRAPAAATSRADGRLPRADANPRYPPPPVTVTHAPCLRTASRSVARSRRWAFLGLWCTAQAAE
eukprot:7240962-Prymnesium_polylepis.1